jgi:hypothetical protein
LSDLASTALDFAISLNCWALERHLPERFARPEVQIAISNQQVSVGRSGMTSNPFLDSAAETEFTRQIVDSQPAELDDALLTPMEAELDPDHARQLEQDRQRMTQWQQPTVYEKPKLMQHCDSPTPPTEPVNEKLQRIRLPNQQELALDREAAERQRHQAQQGEPRKWVAGRPSPESRGDQTPLSPEPLY